MSRRQDHTGNPGAMRRLAAPHYLELLDPGVLDRLLTTLSAALVVDPAERPFISANDLIRALGQALGLRLVAPEWAMTILAIYDDLQWENNAARCAAWTPGPPLRRYAKTGDGGLPLWPNDAAYAAYAARHAATAPPIPAPRNECWLAWAFDQAWHHAEEVAADYAVQIDDARKAVGPALTRGAGRVEALAIARERAPLVSNGDVQTMVDEEAAWWARWRNDRGFRASMAEAT